MLSSESSSRICLEHPSYNASKSLAIGLSLASCTSLLPIQGHERDLPRRLLEHVACTIGNLLVDAARLLRVDFAAAKLLLDRVETYMHMILLET